MKFNSEFCEENLYPLWENFCKSESWSDDLRLQGINAGRLNIFEGPDFQGADFELDGKIYHGDVEIHRTTKEWYHHHHHLDRRYNSVQLHLVWHEEPGVVIQTSENRKIVTIDIKKLPGSSQQKHQKSVCNLSELPANSYCNKLKQLSLDRLNFKVLNVKNLVKHLSYDQVIYLLLMRILGSPNNSINFELFASSFPWEEIIKIKKKNQVTYENWKQLLLTLSGLIKTRPMSGDSSCYPVVCKITTKSASLSPSNWQFSGQRPINHPIKNLKNLAGWLYNFHNDSLYITIKNIITQRLSMRQFLLKLEDVFSPFDLNPRAVEKRVNNKLSEDKWGRAKIVEIVGNSLIPFFYWEATMNSSYGFLEYIRDIYFSLPQLNRYAKLEKFDHLLKEDNPEKSKFYVYQGLLHLNQYYCKTGDCQICPMLYENKEIDKHFENI